MLTLMNCQTSVLLMLGFDRYILIAFVRSASPVRRAEWSCASVGASPLRSDAASVGTAWGRLGKQL